MEFIDKETRYGRILKKGLDKRKRIHGNVGEEFLNYCPTINIMLQRRLNIQVRNKKGEISLFGWVMSVCRCENQMTVEESNGCVKKLNNNNTSHQRLKQIQKKVRF